MSFIIEQAYAGGDGGQQASGLIQFGMLAVFILIFWLLIWRPQNKRAKEHKNLLEGLSKGDEVVTSGGIVGKVASVMDDYIAIQVTENLTVNFQKTAISMALPKGTLKSMK